MLIFNLFKQIGLISSPVIAGRYIYFANNNSAAHQNGSRSENSDAGESEVEAPKQDKKKKKLKEPPLSASIEIWKEYEKNLNARILALEAEKKKKRFSSEENKVLYEFRAAKLAAKRVIRGKEEDKYKEAEVAERTEGLPDDLNDLLLTERRLEVRRFLKHADLLGGEEAQKEKVFTEWEIALLDLHDIDQEQLMLLKGQKFYLGSAEKQEDLQKKADLIFMLKTDLEGDEKRFKENKSKYSVEEQRKKKDEFKKRKKRIQELERRKEREMLYQINCYILELREQRYKKKMEVIGKMVNEFEARLERLLEVWNDPPEEYKYNRAESLRLLGNMKKLLAQFKKYALNGEKNILVRHKLLEEKLHLNDFKDEDLKFLRVFDAKLDASELRSNEKVDSLSEERLEAEAPDIKELDGAYEHLKGRFPSVKEAAQFLKDNKAAILAHFIELREMIERSALSEFIGEDEEGQKKDKEERLKTVEDNIQKIQNNTLEPEALEKGFGEAQKRIDKLRAEIETGDPKKPEIRERRRSYKEALDSTSKYFGQILDFKKDVDGFKDKIKDYVFKAEQIREQRAESEQIEVSVQWITGRDMLRMWERFLEWSKRRWERRSDDRIGKVGSKGFEALGIDLFKSLAADFEKTKESTEMAEVHQYKEAYTNKDTWTLFEVMEHTKNVDEFKACLEVLTDTGRMRWDNPHFWKQLEFFQNTIKICPDYGDEWEIIKLKNNTTELHDRIHKAIGYIWDFDIYFTWRNNNDSAYDRKKGEWKKRVDQISEFAPGALTRRCKEMLTEYKRAVKSGKVPKVNPHEYEAVIEYALENGKMGPEDKLYFLIQGLACGLLCFPERMVYYDANLLNKSPSLEVLSSGTSRGGRPTFKDIQEWAKLDGEANEPKDEFMQWFWSYAANCKKALQRTDKTLTQGPNRMDHDDFTGAIPFAEASTVKQTLSKSSGGEYGMPITAFANASVGYLKYLDNWSLNAKYMDNSLVQLKRFIAAYSVFYNITTNKMFKNRDFYRFSPHILDDPNGPRMGNAYATHTKDRKLSTVKTYLDRTTDLITALEPEIFKKLNAEDLPYKPNGVTEFCNWVMEYLGDPKLFGPRPPTKYDELIERGIPAIVDKLLSGPKAKGRIANLVSAVKEDIKEGKAPSRDFSQIMRSLGSDMPEFSKYSANNRESLPQGFYDESAAPVAPEPVQEATAAAD